MKESDLLLARIRSAVMALNPPAGYSETPVAGLALSRHASAGEQCCCPGEPGVTLILSGVKVSQVGASVLRFRAGEALLAGAAVPTVYSFEGVSESAPFLSMALRLDRALLAEIAEALPARRPASGPERPNGPGRTGKAVQAARPCSCDPDECACEALLTLQPGRELLEDFARLAAILRDPAQTAFRAPLLVRDIHYLLLAGPAGPRLRELLSESAPAGSIVRAVGWLRAHFAKPVAIEELARSFGMSVSSFHRQFKAVTGMSPLQYQKQLRLIEAQRLMLSSRTQVAEAAYAVGYESPTQFVREYKRQFGLPPLRDIRERRRRIAAGESIEGVGPAARAAARNAV